MKSSLTFEDKFTDIHEGLRFASDVIKEHDLQDPFVVTFLYYDGGPLRYLVEVRGTTIGN